MEKYSNKYECPSCHKLFKTRFNCVRHIKTCNKSTDYKFTGGFYNTKSSIFEELEEYGIIIEENHRFYEYFIVFDFEAYLQKIEDSNENTDKTTTTAQHNILCLILYLFVQMLKVFLTLTALFVMIKKNLLQIW